MRANLVLKCPLPGLGELGLDSICYRLGDLLFFQKVNLAFGRMHVDINRCGVELYAKEPSLVLRQTTEEGALPEVYKWRSAFWKNACVTSFYGLLDPRGLYQTIYKCLTCQRCQNVRRSGKSFTIYEQQKDHFFGVIVRVGKVRLSYPTVFGRLAHSWSTVVCIALSFFGFWMGNVDTEQVLGYALAV